MSKSDIYRQIGLADAVSFPSEELVLVDEDDREVGYASKKSAHEGQGQRHRAFSVFLFDERQRLLLHRRSEHKPLWPGYWTNSCCSHPRRGEELLASVHRRLEEELGCTATAVSRLCAFEYQAAYNELGTEHELCHVFLARVTDPFAVFAHPLEISELSWCELDAVDVMMETERHDLTPWFRLEWALLRGECREPFLRWLRAGEEDSGEISPRVDQDAEVLI